jgi:hypothetical protein
VSRRRGTAWAGLVLTAVVALAWWLASKGEQGGELAGPVQRATTEADQFPDADAPVESPQPLVSSVAESTARVVALRTAPVSAVPRAHCVHDGLVSLDDDGRGLTGRVLDANGRGLAGAQLLLVRESWGHHGDLSIRDEDRATADAQGRYRLRLEHPVGIEELRLYVSATGFPPWIGRVEPVGDGSDIVLGPLQTMVLQLLFADGGPIAGATVRWEDPTWEEDHENQRDIVGITTVGQTDTSGRLTLSVPVARPEVSLIVRHDLHVGRHLVPLDAWRAAGATAPIVISVPGPRGAALELIVDDWDEAVLRATPFVSLSLAAYERGPEGKLVLAQSSLSVPSAGGRGDSVEAGRALVADLEAPAYRVTLWAWGNRQVLNECWVPVPGLTTWHARLPWPDGTWKAPLRVEFAASDGSALADVWGNRSRQLEATQGEACAKQAVSDPSQPVALYLRGEGPVTLSLAELGEAGVRTDVPASGTYRFVLEPELFRSGHGELRVDLSAIVPAPPPDDVWLHVRPEGHPVERVDGRLEVQGLPAGPCRVWVYAGGVDEESQLVNIEPGRTSVLLARAERGPPWGRIRGRVVIHGDDSWMRLTRVRLRNTETGELADGSWQVGLKSFFSIAEPGQYEGEVIVGRLASAAARAERFPDVTMLDPHHWDAPELIGRFTAEVRLGEITDVVVEVDATQLATVHVTAPAGAPTDDPGGTGWYIEALDPAGQRVAIAWFGGWTAEGVTLRLQPGRYTLSACHGPAASRPPAWTAEIDIPPAATALEVQLAPSGD